MTILEILRLDPNPDLQSEPINLGFGRRVGDVVNHREVTLSRKVDDLSRHESKHEEAPKHVPRVNHRERPKDPTKPAAHPPYEQNQPPGFPRK